MGRRRHALLYYFVLLAFLAPVCAEARLFDSCRSALGWLFGQKKKKTAPVLQHPQPLLKPFFYELLQERHLFQSVEDGARLKPKLDDFEKSLSEEQKEAVREALGSLPLKLITSADGKNLERALYWVTHLPDQHRLLGRLLSYARKGALPEKPSMEFIRALDRLEEAQIPWDTAYYLSRSSSPRERALELVDFHTLTLSPLSTEEKAKRLNEWARSAEHALYAYQNLNDFASSEIGPLLDALIRDNPYFKDVHRNRGPPASLITFSYEKETQSPSFSLLYRPKDMTDAAWLDLPELKRQGVLSLDETLRSHAPTALKPDSAGKYHLEMQMLPELTHRSYEITPQRLLSAMREVASALKETQGFHVHLVFELPRNYTHTQAFFDWYKQLNDYLFLAGLEEGLHPNSFTMIPLETELQQRSFQTLGDTSLKYYNAGLRQNSDTFGFPSAPNFHRLSLELRDATKDMDRWEKYVLGFTRSLENRVWEGKKKNDPRTLRLFPPLLVSEKRTAALLQMIGLSPQESRELAYAEPNVTLPLIEFEKHRYYDYRAGRYQTIEREVARRIGQARQRYVRELFQLQKNLQDLKTSNQRYERDDIKMAIRWTLTDWARRARVSELLGRL